MVIVLLLYFLYIAAQGKEVSFLFPVDLFWWVVAFSTFGK